MSSHSAHARPSRPFPPALRGLECPRPVRQLEAGILAGGRIVDLLGDPERRSERIGAVCSVEVDHGGERLGRLLHQLPVSLERRAARSGAIEQLAEVNRLRLVPHDQRVAAGALASLGADHLRPTRAAQPAVDRELASRRQVLAIPLEVPDQQVLPPPQGEVSGVPPDHLGVMLPVPGVADEPALLRWHGGHRLDGGEVLRQDDATLQLRRPRIRAPAEIDGASPPPERGPVASRRAERLVHAWKRTQRRRREADGQLEWARAGARDLQLVPLGPQLHERRVPAPPETDVKAGRVTDTLQLQVPRPSPDDARRVGLRFCPIERRRVLDVQAVAPREGHAHAQSSRSEQR